jgi:molybdopterin/thiamine biosynthesis adenylyltransferase
MTKVLLVGAGGIGCPLVEVLYKHVDLTVIDADRVEESNLHRQISYDDKHIGQSKVGVLAERFGVRAVLDRVRIDNVLSLLRGVAVVVDGCDSLAVKFMLADACYLAKKTLVSAACVGWYGTVFVRSGGCGACYRCLFEDVVEADRCETVGIVPPVAGITAALAADFAFAALAGDTRSRIAHFDGHNASSLRIRVVNPRASCNLCGAGRRIRSLDNARYPGLA